MKNPKIYLILVFLTCNQLLQAQTKFEDYREVFLENNINQDKNILFQKYLAENFYVNDSLAIAQHIKSMNIVEVNNKWKYTRTAEFKYDKSGRNIFNHTDYDYFNQSRKGYSSMYILNYNDDTSKHEWTSYRLSNGKIEYISNTKKLSDSVLQQIYKNKHLKTYEKTLNYTNSNHLVYKTEKYKGRKLKLYSTAQYEYYANNNLSSKKLYNNKGKLKHSWVYMDCGESYLNNDKKVDTVNFCKSTSVDKEGNTHTYITYTAALGTVYKHEKVTDKNGALINHITVKQKTGKKYNEGMVKYRGDTLVYSYLKYYENSGKLHFIDEYKYKNNILLSHQSWKYSKKGSLRTHEGSLYTFDNLGKPLKKIYSNYLENFNTEMVYTYNFY